MVLGLLKKADRRQRSAQRIARLVQLVAICGAEAPFYRGELMLLAVVGRRRGHGTLSIGLLRGNRSAKSRKGAHRPYDQDTTLDLNHLVVSLSVEVQADGSLPFGVTLSGCKLSSRSPGRERKSLMCEPTIDVQVFTPA